MNIQQTIAQLARLPDAALQQYAAANKHDANAVALASSEFTRRQAARQSAQGAQPGQQGSVVDRTIAGMNQNVPEQHQIPTYLQGMAQQPPVQGAQPQTADSGIAQLPSGPMSMAGGGLVSFAGGGDVPGYSGESSSLVGWTDDTVHRGAAPFSAGFDPYAFRRLLGMEDAAAPVHAPVPAVAGPNWNPDRSFDPKGTAPRVDAVPPPPGADLAAEAAAPSGAPTIGGLAGIGAPLKALGEKRLQEDTVAADEETKRLAAYGKPFAGMEALLAKQREGDVSDMQHAKGTGIARLGMGIMSSTQPLLSAVGTAGQPALTEYEATRREVQKGADARDMQQMQLEEARRSEERGDTKDAYTRRLAAKVAGRAAETSAVTLEAQARMAEYTAAQQSAALDKRLRSAEDIADIRAAAASALANARTEEARNRTKVQLIAAFMARTPLPLAVTEALDSAAPGTQAYADAQAAAEAARAEAHADAVRQVARIEANVKGYSHTGTAAAPADAPSTGAQTLAQKYGFGAR